MARIAWDTNVFVYLLEDKGHLGQKVAELRKRMSLRGDTLCTSWLTYGELLVKPHQLGRSDLARR